MKCTQPKTYTREAMKDLFDFCLLPPEDQEYMEPLWMEMAKKMDINDEVIYHAMNEWLPQTKDIRYKGVRMAIGATLYEFCDIQRLQNRLDAGEHVERLYGVMPVVLAPYYTVKAAAGDKAYVGFPDLLFMEVMQQFFHHAEHLFELSEDNGMAYGVRHCALNKVGIAGRLSGVVPEPTVMWSWGLVCDEATKIDEFLKYKQNGNWKSFLTRYPHDTYMNEIDYDDEERTAYLAKSLKNAIEGIGAEMGVEILPEHSKQAVQAFVGYMMKFAAISGAIAMAEVPPIRNNTLSILSLPAAIPFNAGFERLGKACDVLLGEIKEAIAEGYGVVPKGAPRVGMYFNPGNNPWFEAQLNKNGVAIVASMTSAPDNHSRRPSRYEDPYMQMAEQWQHMDFGMNCGCSVNDWVDKLTNSRAEAMICGFLDYDRWLNQLQKIGAREVEKKMGIPAFYLEADFYDDRDYSEEALKTRIETMCSIIKMSTRKRRAKLAAEAAQNQ